MRKNLHSFSEYVFENSQIVDQLVRGYNHADAALSCGSMLRECVRYNALANHILYSDLIWLFFDSFVQMRNFEVASDSFTTLKELLTTPWNKSISSEFLVNKYDEVMAHYEVCVFLELCASAIVT